MRIDWDLGMLKGAARLVPRSLRAEWLAEWKSELWYVRRSQAAVTRFCLGAFPDALCLRRSAGREASRLESPTQCLLLLAASAAAALLLSFTWPVHSERFLPPPDDPDARLIALSTHRRAIRITPTITFGQYDAWVRHMPPQFTAVAFYERLPHLPNAALAPPRQAMPQLPAATRGFVIARMRTAAASFGHIVLPTADGAYDAFDYRALAPRMNSPFSALAIMSVIAWLVLRVTPWSSSARHRLRPWIFLAVKLLLILPIVVFGALDLAYLAGKPLEAYLLLGGWFVAFRWVLRDQQRRCPVCLRLLINPVGMGQASQTFLGWYGTELMCAKGHGMLQVAELPTSSSSPSRWVQLDPSWSGLF